MEEDRVRALADTKLAYDRLIDTIESKFTSAIGGQVLEIEKAQKAGLNWFQILGQLHQGTLALATAQVEENKALAEWNRMIAQQGKGQDINLPKETRPAAPDYAAELAAAKQEIDLLSASTKTQIDAAIKLGATMDDLQKQYGLSADAAKIYSSYTKEVEAAQTAAAKTAADNAAAEAAYGDEIAKVGLAISTLGVKQKIQDMAAAVAEATKDGGLATDSLKQYGKQIDEWLDQGYKIPPVLSDVHYQYVLLEASQRSAKDTLKELLVPAADVTQAFKQQGAEAAKLATAMDYFNKLVSDPKSQQSLDALIRKLPSIKLPPPPEQEFDVFLDELGKVAWAFSGLEHTGISAIDGIASATMGAIGVMEQYKKISAMPAGTDKNMAIAGAAVSGIGGVVSGIKSGSKAKGALSGAEEGMTIGMYGGPLGMAIGAGVGAVAGAVAASKHNTTKDARDALAQQLGFTDCRRALRGSPEAGPGRSRHHGIAGDRPPRRDG